MKIRYRYLTDVFILPYKIASWLPCFCPSKHDKVTVFWIINDMRLLYLSRIKNKGMKMGIIQNL